MKYNYNKDLCSDSHYDISINERYFLAEQRILQIKIKSVGRSSGRDVALVDVGGIIQEIRSDIGCIYAFKPYSGRIPYYGGAKISLRSEGVLQQKVSKGPIAGNDDLIL